MAKFGQNTVVERAVPSLKKFQKYYIFTFNFFLGVQYPKVNKPDISDIYKDNKPSISVLKHHFQQEGRLTEKAASQIIIDATKLLKQEPNLLEVETPVNSLL